MASAGGPARKEHFSAHFLWRVDSYRRTPQQVMLGVTPLFLIREEYVLA